MQVTSYYDKGVQALRDQVRAWAEKVVQLHNTEVPAEFEDEKQALLVFAQKIKQTVEGVTGTIPELAPMTEIGLGLLPVVIGVVGGAGAAAAITKWVLDYNKFKLKIQDRNALIASGMSAQAASNIVEQTSNTPTMFSEPVKLVKYGVGAGILYYIAKTLKVI